MEETIVSAAVYQGVIISLPPPARHHTIIHSMKFYFDKDGLVCPSEQGFLTSKGRYVNRVEAYGIAYKAKQTDSEGPELFSEDLW